MRADSLANLVRMVEKLETLIRGQY
jgi:hypothetical protein